MGLRFRACVAKIKRTYLRVILGLAVITVTSIVYTNSAVLSTMQNLQNGDFSINITGTSAHKSNETTKNDTQHAVINYMLKWQPVVSHNIGANLFSGDNTTAVPSQNNNEIKSMRSGSSSFIGRILPEIFSLFEPL